MAKYALIRGGKTERVIVADQAFIDANPSLYERAVRVAAHAEEDPEAEVFTRDCEPDATFDGVAFTRVPRTGEPSLEERVAALEASRGGGGR